MLNKQLKVGSLELAVLLCIAEYDVIVLLGRGRGNGLDHFRVERISDIRDDQPDEVAPAGDERPGGVVGRIPEPFHRTADAQARRLADAAAVVDDPGNGCLRDLRLSGNVPAARLARPRVAGLLSTR